MIYHLHQDSHMRNKVKVTLELCNYATKIELKHAADVDTSDLAVKEDIITLTLIWLVFVMVHFEAEAGAKLPQPPRQKFVTIMLET